MVNCMKIITAVTAAALVAGRVPSAGGAEVKPAEADFYAVTTLTIPEEAFLEVGALEWLPDGRMAVASRRGEIWMVTDPTGAKPSWTRFAHGLHEVLGLAWKDGWLYATQRPEVSRLRDVDGDGVAEVFETVADGWGVSGDYHEYAFGSKFDREGNIWVALCLTGSFNSKVPFRGWAMRVTPDGQTIPTTSGIRSPGGIGFELEFTAPVDAATAGDPASYAIRSFTHIYQSSYGSPEVDVEDCPIERAEVSADGRRVRLAVGSLRPCVVHEIKADGIRSAASDVSAAGLPLLHDTGWYTLNRLPK
jgi:hypothetical protein